MKVSQNGCRCLRVEHHPNSGAHNVRLKHTVYHFLGNWFCYFRGIKLILKTCFSGHVFFSQPFFKWRRFFSGFFCWKAPPLFSRWWFHFFNFHPYLRGDSHFEWYFSNGLSPSASFKNCANKKPMTKFSQAQYRRRTARDLPCPEHLFQSGIYPGALLATAGGSMVFLQLSDARWMWSDVSITWCLMIFYGFYYGKSPVNHRLGQ